MINFPFNSHLEKDCNGMALNYSTGKCTFGNSDGNGKPN